MLPALVEVLAQIPGTDFINPWKLLAMVVVFTLWAFFAQWVDKDTVAVNTFRILWNLIVMGAGVVALAAMLLVPEFVIGLAVFLAVNLIVGTVYVVHRNGMVEEADKVFTPAHVARLAREGFRSKKKEPKEVKERVRLTGPDRKVITIPTDEILREQYRLTQDMLFDALWRRASVIEITPGGQVSRITYLIDGIPTEREKMPRADADAVVMYIKRCAALNLEERRKPQAGKLVAAVGENKMDLMVRTDGSTAGEKLLLRFVSAEKTYKVKDLGFTDKQLEQVRTFMEAPRGLVVLSSSPAGGLTTMVYSFTRSQDAFLQNIQMVEYQKELDVDNVTQHVFQPAGDKTFANDLQKVVRSDPDIIVIPEVRDRQTATLCCEAALNKQKVYVGIPQSPDVLEALRKWMKLVGDNGLVAKSLLAVINGRMVRKLCTECRQPYKPDAAQLKKLNMPADKVLYRPPEPQYDKHGNPIICQNCQGSGYFGRIGIFDVLVVDDGLREVLRRARTLDEIKSYALKIGGFGLQQQALHKVLDGVTSIQEVVRATRPPSSDAPPATPSSGGPDEPAPSPKTGGPAPAAR